MHNLLPSSFFAWSSIDYNKSPSLEKLSFSRRLAPDLHTIKSQRIDHFRLEKTGFRASRRQSVGYCLSNSLTRTVRATE
jgi:hypothetical protein